MATGFNVRVGDADRDAVAAQLREHYADGRLTFDELNERLDQTFAAKTRADLNMVMRDLPPGARPVGGAPSGSFGTTAWQGPSWPAPTRPGGSGWDSGTGNSRQGRPFGAFAPLMGLVWVFVILGAVMLFGSGGDRPLAIVLIIAALAFIRRLFGFGARRRGNGGPRGPKGPRGPRGPRGPHF
jgi:Domain of unknown function (DUF1707)